MKILVVCGAGASSTFVAQRLQRAADADGFDCAVAATTLTMLAGELASCDLVLLGPHLRDRHDEIVRDAAAHNARAALLPGDVFGDLDGSRTLALVRTVTASDRPADPPLASTSTSDRPSGEDPS
jgi:PTS system cellobiose-specific IIB component